MMLAAQFGRTGFTAQVLQHDLSFELSREGPTNTRLVQRQERTLTISGADDLEKWFLLVPNTAAGEKVALLVSHDTPGGQVLNTSRSNEVTFCRELRLRPTDVREAVRYYRESYEERSHRPAPSPHARFDVVEWLPLDV